jgi:hypothetical protein
VKAPNKEQLAVLKWRLVLGPIHPKHVRPTIRAALLRNGWLSANAAGDLEITNAGRLAAGDAS